MTIKAILHVATAASILQTTTATPAKIPNIVGGEPAKEGEFPYIIALAQPDRLLCGGTLLNANTVLTAAHCTDGSAYNTSVRAGSLLYASGGTVSKVSSYIIHPKYEAEDDPDLAIWKLTTPIEEGSTIRYAKLPDQASDPAGNSMATIAGWGALAEDEEEGPKTLYKVSVPVIDRQACSDLYKGRVYLNVTDNMICTGMKEGGRNSCYGDSGGPVVDAATGVLIGIVSWGKGCARPDSPSVHTRVANYVDFIKKYM